MPITECPAASVAFIALFLALASCRGAPLDPPGAAPSPQATAEPAPLASTTGGGPAATALGGDGGAVPEPLQHDRALPVDTPHEPGSKDSAKETRELSGYVLQALIRSGEGPGPPRGSEVNAAEIDSARRKAEERLTISVSQTRARVVLSGAFVVPQGTELRSRIDRYGHLLLWPGEGTYRIAEPSALRALLGERRLDVAPVSRAEGVPAGEGQHHLNTQTRRVDVSTRAARATLELGTFKDAGDGGVLICRLLLDLMSATTTATAAGACATDEIPLHAELHWTTRGMLTFDVTSIARRTDLAAQDLAAPPAGWTFSAAPLPPLAADAWLPKGELAAFRTAAVDVATSPPRDAQAPMAPESGLYLVNSSDQLRLAWLDSVPVAWVAAGGRIWLPSLPRGRYVLEWRTFLGDSWEPPEPMTLPGASEVGAARAAAP